MLNETDKLLLGAHGIPLPKIGLPEGWIKINEIKIPPTKFRSMDDYFQEHSSGLLKDIEANIKDNGLKDKITLNEKFELIDGFLRVKAFQLLGYTIIPYFIEKEKNNE